MITPKTFARIGRWFYALALIGSGVEQLITRQYVRLIPQPPSSPPTVWPLMVGIVLIVVGGMILIPWRGRLAAGVVAGLLLVSFVFQYIPVIMAAPQHGFVWTNPCKVLALIGGALVLVAALHRESSGTRATSGDQPGRFLIGLGRVFLAIFLILCGAQHFAYLDFVVTLVPAWAGNARMWSIFTGSALLAGGLGLLIPFSARWAATLTGLMIFLWVLLLHIPRALNEPAHAMELASAFEALALSGVALLFAAHGSPSKKVAVSAASSVLNPV